MKAGPGRTLPVSDIRRMFSALAPEYQRFNFWSSLGLDQCWRRRLMRELPEGPVLDLGAGTGDLTRLAARRAGGRFPVVGVDFSREMLLRAQEMSGRGPGTPLWVQAGAESLPFPSGVFSAVVSAYVMRNLQKAGVLPGALREAFRVLSAGGKILFLDLTRPRNPLVRWGHNLYMRTVVPAVGRAMFGGRWPGDYLESSIQELLPAAKLKELFESAGFSDFRVRPLWGGVVSLFSGTKTC